MAMRAVAVLGLIATLCAGARVPFSDFDTPFEGKQATVYYNADSGKYQIRFNVIDVAGAAYGSYDSGSNHPSNFGVLKIVTNPAFEDNVQMFAAGYLEGALTAGDLFNMYTNLISTFTQLQPGPSANLTKFLADQDDWARANVRNNPTDKYWIQLGAILAQYDGLAAGYKDNHLPSQELDQFAFFVLNGCGDLFDLIPATSPTQVKSPKDMSKEEFSNFVFNNGHCSAIVKLTGDFSQLFMSHSSWFRYQAMLRIMKHYWFQTRNSAVKKLSFSSYPGFLESLDDFYLMDTGLVMLQTTNDVFDYSLYQYVTPQTLMAWQRVRIGCALATTGEEWTRLVGLHNSGTYNNQYMVIDLKKFTPKQPLVPGTLWVSEQIPGTYVAADQTAQLERGYWPSYNVAYYPEIYNISGYPAMVAKYGTDYSYDLAPRAKIFRRDQGTIDDMDSLQAFMRYNDYKNDPYSDGSASKAICSRGDLSSRPSAGGCYDTKVTEYSYALKLQSWALNGPTTSHDLPPFSWSQFPTDSHVGMPELFNFTFEFQDPQWN